MVKFDGQLCEAYVNSGGDIISGAVAVIACFILIEETAANLLARSLPRYPIFSCIPLHSDLALPFN